MTGTVDFRRRPVVPVLLTGPIGQARVEALVDTGFGGALSLPTSVIRRLGLARHGPTLLMDPTGKVSVAQRYVAQIGWLPGTVSCLAVENNIDCCLIGTELLDGFCLQIDFGPAKRVEVR